MTGERLEPGTELRGYRIERFVGQGGMGVVYEATQLSLERRVALKLISERLGSDERFRDRFRHEARAAAKIDHPNILPVYETDELPDGRLFLAMRFVDGPDLDSLLRARGPLNAEQTVAVLSQIGEALDAAHQQGVIHRDVKPANVLLESRESGWRAYLTDFGLAKEQTEVTGVTGTGQVLGTVDYMAPEQGSGRDIDAAVDVYAFGCTTFCCLTGEPPYPRENANATLLAHVTAPVPVPSEHVEGIPSALDILVAQAMEKDPAVRAASAGALMRRAAAQMMGETVADPPINDDVRKAPPEELPPLRRTPFRLRVAYHTLAYAPLWAGAYILGRHL